MNSPMLKRIASGLIAVLLLVYVGYQIYRSHYSSVKTEMSIYFTASNSIETPVVALRREVLLTPSVTGAVDYSVNSGDRVSKGGVIAQIYKDESQITAKHQLEDTDRAITQLQNLQQPGNTYSFNPDTANGRICQQLSQILGKARSGDLEEAASEKSSLLSLLNEKQIAAGQVKNFSAKISALQAQHKTLAAEAGSPVNSIRSPAAGYFIGSADGLENAYDLSKIDSITCSDVKRLQSLKASSVQGAVGKISRDFDWYLVCTVPYDRLASLKQVGTDETVSVRFPFVSGVSVPASVEAINQSGANSEAAVVLKCQGLNSELAGIRHETADISVQEYTGLRVSQKAIHYETKTGKLKDASGKVTKVTKDVEGVYVLHGNQLNFRQIVPQLSTDSYVICDPHPDPNSLLTDETVKLYDEVVVEGTDLYDGKVVK